MASKTGRKNNRSGHYTYNPEVDKYCTLTVVQMANILDATRAYEMDDDQKESWLTSPSSARDWMFQTFFNMYENEPNATELAEEKLASLLSYSEPKYWDYISDLLSLNWIISKAKARRIYGE